MVAGTEASTEIFATLHTKAAQAVLAMGPTAMVIADRNGHIQAFSKSAQDLFGFTEPEVLGRDIGILMSSHHRQRHASYVELFFSAGGQRAIGKARTENGCRKDGSVFPVEIMLGESELDAERCVIAFIRSLSSPELHQRELTALLADLARNSRVAAMGALATAIAHELNQPLTAVSSYAQGLRDLIERNDDLPERAEYIRLLDNCIRQAMRAGQLLHRVREFVRGGGPQPQPMSVAEVIDDAIGLALINGSKRTVKVSTRVAEGLPCAMVDATLAQQVVFNLLRNAIEAIDARDGLDHRMIVSAGLAIERGFIEIRVEDNGPGIPREVAETLFDSFVTTKSGGMGIGLAICRQIVVDWGGTIDVDRSEELGGACFRFTVPVAAARRDFAKLGRS